MSDDRDPLDARLVAEGDLGTLFAAYYPVVLNRLRLRLRNDGDAYEVAQRVFERLCRELMGGKAYPVPFRVVVHKAADWTYKAFLAERHREQGDPLPDEIAGGPDGGIIEVEERAWMESLFRRLPDRERQVMTLVHLDGLTIEETARRLAIERNAVDQALHRARRRLRELMDDG